MLINPDQALIGVSSSSRTMPHITVTSDLSSSRRKIWKKA